MFLGIYKLQGKAEHAKYVPVFVPAEQGGGTLLLEEFSGCQ
jgi:hypothetical protein